MENKKSTCGDCQLIIKCNGYDDDEIDEEFDEMFRGIDEPICEKFTPWQKPKKHCAECKYVNGNFTDGYECILLNVPLENTDVDEDEHCYLEDCHSVKETFPHLLAEALAACPHYAIQYGREEWLDDNELFMDLQNRQVASLRTDLILEWLQEEQAKPAFK